MFSAIRTAALSALIGFGAIAATPAAADSLYLGFGSGHNGPTVGFHFGDSGHAHRAPRYHRPARRCTPAQAVRKAARLGVNRARVRNHNRNVIRVVGRARGERVRLVFAKAPGCPVIR